MSVCGVYTRYFLTKGGASFLPLQLFTIALRFDLLRVRADGGDAIAFV